MVGQTNKEIKAELISIAAWLIRSDNFPSDNPDDYPHRRYSAEAVADMMYVPRACLIETGMKLRRIANKIGE